tara:strand:+ start:943 stop:1308 length:366 start_codon:yes stop_codon:yes gene_type:complete
MEVKGTVKLKLQLESGVSKSGKTWKKQTVVIDTGGEFNNEIAVSAFGDEKLASLNKLEVGMEVKILCNVYSREYKGRYFHNIDGYHFAIMGSKEKTWATTEDMPTKEECRSMYDTPEDLPF